jgi:ATP-dependent exoDNAse (exonuclease V) alpha subunit
VHIVAIYHLTAKIVTRSAGRSVVAAAAYRAGERLEEIRTGNTYDFTHKRGIEHSEILVPDGAPGWTHDRSKLWNGVDEHEKRKDAQLARDLEIALPIELDATAQVALLRDYVNGHFVSKGMIADCAIHRDNPNNPHAHVLLTMRPLGKNGFGLKERSWNARASLDVWRRGWEQAANQHLALAGLSVRIDHRTLKAQQLDLIPGRKIGVSLERQQSTDLPPRIAERVVEQRAIAAENGSQIIIDPKVAIKALTHYNSTFTRHDVAKFLHTRTAGAEQFRTAYLKVTMSPELAVLATDDRGHERYTSREMNSDLDSRKPTPMTMSNIDTLQQQAAERWREKHRTRQYEPSAKPEPSLPHEKDLDPTKASPDQNLQKQLRLEHPDPEDDLEL